MKNLLLYPSQLCGEMRLPLSKSEVLRLILMVACGSKPCMICGDFSEPCDDILAMLQVAHGLGACWTMDSFGLLISPGKSIEPAVCNVGICATALRLSLPVFLLKGIPVRFVMKRVLFNRCGESIRRFLSEVEKISLLIEEKNEEVHLVFNGTLAQSVYVISAQETSQLLSGLVLGLAVSQKGSFSVKVKGDISSRPYFDLTLSLLCRYGCFVNAVEQTFVIPAGVLFLPEKVYPEPDASSAVFPAVLSALGAKLTIRFPSSSVQADTAVLHDLQDHDWISETVLPIIRNCNANPDAAPMMALLASKANGLSCLSGLRRLRDKECDRYAATMEILSAFGVKISAPNEDCWYITGPTVYHGGFSISSHGDHRMAMLITAAAFFSDAPVVLKGADCVHKSWPCFFEECVRLGGKVEWQAE